jgi:hypothetical protein
MHARALWILPLVLGAASCAQSKSAPAASSSPSQEMPGAPPMSASRGPAFAPDETWIHRTLQLGPTATLTVSTLARDRTHATLVVETRTASSGANKEAADLAWETSEIHRYAGAITADSGGHFEVRMLEGDSPMEHVVTCTKSQRSVSAAGSTLVADPKPKPGCADHATWKPGTRSASVELLACGSDDYARSPGLETLELSPECGAQGAGERLIPDDGAFAPAR